MHVDAVAGTFLIVETEVLYAGCDTVALNTLYILYRHLAAQIRVFAHIFKVPAAQWCSENIDSGTEKDILLPVARLFADTDPIQTRHFFIPCRSQTRQGRKGHYGIVCPPGLVPFVPLHFRTDSVGAVRAPQFRNAKAGNTGGTEFALGVDNCDFLFQTHPSEKVFHPLFNRQVLVLERKFLGKARHCHHRGNGKIQHSWSHYTFHFK